MPEIPVPQYVKPLPTSPHLRPPPSPPRHTGNPVNSPLAQSVSLEDAAKEYSRVCSPCLKTTRNHSQLSRVNFARPTQYGSTEGLTTAGICPPARSQLYGSTTCWSLEAPTPPPSIPLPALPSGARKKVPEQSIRSNFYVSSASAPGIAVSKD